jgi:hypothetical protein
VTALFGIFGLGTCPGLFLLEAQRRLCHPAQTADYQGANERKSNQACTAAARQQAAENS